MKKFASVSSFAFLQAAEVWPEAEDDPLHIASNGNDLITLSMGI